MKQTSQIKVNLPEIVGKGYGQFWRSKNFYRVVKGGRGSKKSKTTALYYIVAILKHNWANLLVVRRFSNTNKQSTYTDLKWAANRLNVSHLFKFNESLPEITVKATGQKILFRGLDDPLKITSITVDTGLLSWLWLEEAYQVENQDKFETLVESIRGSIDAPDFFKQITITFNPWSERHWLKSAFFDEDTRKKDVFADTTTYRVNEWLDQQDIDRYEDLWRTNPRRAAVVANGDWGVAEGLVFENYEVKDFDIVSTIKRIGETTAGLDFGFTHDPTTFPRLAVDLDNRELWIYAEHYEHAMTTDDIFKMIVDADLQNAVITADSAEQRLIAELQAKGVRRLVPSIKGKGSINAGIDFMKQFKIYIHPSCVKTIEEFDTYIYKQDKDGKWLNEPIDSNNHIIDAIRYALERYHIQTSKLNVDKTIKKINKMFRR
ncbi:PBSX family phage terminase large subunit [Streptococcus suis]|uniref:PBSX family phage terminase large subunit n=1 Tax=Streptococcus suis TaxID=1307 RepID=UPI0011478074|nr:PBSX family phage terminase large subunit [Streptococcus suis]NQI77367.1 PBSX family phage terminase large subunit [Streptococcus suis]NQI79582.1 PBSX family phage terminase large subunit [Streptococcus suis]NQI82674.1 PBSX family phage terminase large subunit [Streptococcus suis]TQE79975.1 PBSX family phage terminase large subunit [Streptococcus suis]